jgi:hypothetical protein
MRRNYTEAAKWYGKAADRDHVHAQSSLGLLYVKGLGVPQDYSKAMMWFRRSAERGYALAQNNLGFMHATGRGTKINLILACMWFTLAAENGDKGFAQNKAKVASYLTTAQLIEASELARKFKERHQLK